MNSGRHIFRGPKSLIVTFYLWFLLALTLTVASAGAVFALWSDGRWEERIAELALINVRLARDLTELSLSKGAAPEELGRLLAPVLEKDRASLAILEKDGVPLLVLPHPQAGAGDPVIPAPDAIRAIGGGEEVVELQWRRRFAIGLPIGLPSGETGVFYVTGHRHLWPDREGSPRFLFGLGAILVVGWLLCWPLAAHLARPLRRMSRTADAVGRGDLSARIRLHRRDEIGRLARSFNAMADNLQQMVLGHKRLLGDISHELRSPLARLRVALELARGEAGGAAEDYLARAERETGALDGLIEELLTYSRLDASPHELHREAVDLSRLIREVVEQEHPEAEARDVTLDVEAEGLPPVTAERRLLARALGNVLRNAIAHAPPGTAVRIAAKQRSGRLEIAVSDRGPGVPNERLERIFEPFVREDPARSRATGGVGLGLAIARRAMEAHGGGARARLGEEGRGLTVELWLPLDVPESP